MAKIHTLKIKNFRGIKDFEQVFGMTDFVCLIGRGDSGKTTILNAISMVLSPSWNLSFYDTDFYNCEIDKNIEIEATLYDLPDNFLRENKYGLYIRGIDKDSHRISDELNNNQIPIPALTIKLTVDRELEPQWHIINGREQEPIEIKASDRAVLNTFLISDYVDRHFSWSKGNPLYSLLKLEDTADNIKSNLIVDAMREAKSKVDSGDFSHLQGVINKVESTTRTLGVPIQSITTSIDFKDFTSNENKVYLHEEKIPFKQRGKGSKRLISTAIQLELVKKGGILLIDEVEQGLEPDRVQHLIRTLKNTNKGQIFISTHSRDVLVELGATNVYILRKGNKSLNEISPSINGCLRSNPESFFAKKIIICEGATEVGICRAINDYRVEKEQLSLSYLGICIADGEGTNFVNYCLGYLELGYDVCIFCDSDDKVINNEKANLKSKGATIIDCETDKSIEQQIFDDVPKEIIQALIEYIIDEKGEGTLKDNLINIINPLPQEWKTDDSYKMRDALGKSSKSKGFYKKVYHGIFLGSKCLEGLQHLVNDEKHLGKQFTQLSNWIDNGL